MSGSSYIALSGMRTRLDQLDRLGDDIANAATAGYKMERTSQTEAVRPPFDAIFQTAIDVTSGDRRLDTTAGSINPTGRDLDVAIEGQGFFVVQTAGGVRYTRNGHFSRRADGVLTTDDGNVVQGTTGPLTLGPGKIAVDEDGAVRTGGAVAGRLSVVEFADPGKLVREGGAMRADGILPQPATKAVVRSGSLEQSNVSIVERIAELTNVRRSFEALQKAVSLQMNDIDGRAIEILGRR